MTKEEAKDYIREWCPYDRQEEIIKTLEQEPKTGHWISCAEEYGKPVKWVCSSCRDIKSITKNKTEYCPVCGARLGMTDKEIVDKLTELTAGSILNFKDAMDLLCEIKRILSRRDRSE